MVALPVSACRSFVNVNAAVAVPFTLTAGTSYLSSAGKPESASLMDVYRCALGTGSSSRDSRSFSGST